MPSDNFCYQRYNKMKQEGNFYKSVIYLYPLMTRKVAYIMPRGEQRINFRHVSLFEVIKSKLLQLKNRSTSFKNTLIETKKIILCICAPNLISRIIDKQKCKRFNLTVNKENLKLTGLRYSLSWIWLKLETNI